MTALPDDRPAERPVSSVPRDGLGTHPARVRRGSALLGEIRQIVFGAQDGLVATLAIVATVAGASGSTYPVVVAGIASGLAGMFSMGAGEYIGSKSQREIDRAQVANERDEVRERPAESEAEVAALLMDEGMPADEAAQVASLMGRHPEVLLRAMVSKELGITVDARAGSPLQAALLMGAAFGLGAMVPVVPFLALPVGAALAVSVALTGLVLFGIGAVKSRWTRRSAVRSGLEVVAVGAFAGIAGYAFGTMLPGLLGGAGISA
jgi:VIT1/CCC1 family predicted Fe2+/Mn2+ transporter